MHRGRSQTLDIIQNFSSGRQGHEGDVGDFGVTLVFVSSQASQQDRLSSAGARPRGSQSYGNQVLQLICTPEYFGNLPQFLLNINFEEDSYELEAQQTTKYPPYTLHLTTQRHQHMTLMLQQLLIKTLVCMLVFSLLFLMIVTFSLLPEVPFFN